MENKKLEDYTKEELIAEIKALKKRKKFGLVWENKKENVVEECKNKIPILIENESKSIQKVNDQPTHIIIEGDNYHALSVLNYTHAGKIDLIYIDPPYNTGNNSWKYNNKFVNLDDNYRHSKWINMMYERLRIASLLLKPNGVICLAIDDYELPNIWLILDSIFGEDNRLSTLVIENNPRGRTSSKFYATSHEYYLIYSNDIKKAKIVNPSLTVEQAKVYKENDEFSKYRWLPLRKSGAESRRRDRPKQYFPVYFDKDNKILSLKKTGNNSIEIWPVDRKGEERCWKIGIEKFQQSIINNDIKCSFNNGKVILSIKDRIKNGRKPKTVWIDSKFDSSAHGSNLLLKMFDKKVFDYPKSLWAVFYYLTTTHIIKDKNSIVLDFFAGSGTTGHAVLELNKKDSGNRQFILCTNNENKICEEVTYPRIKKVIDGYSDKEGIPANVRYFKTDFIDKVGSTDKIRRTLLGKCLEMLKVKENSFEELYNSKEFSIFKGFHGVMGVCFDPMEVDNFCKKIEALGIKNINIYIFSYDSDTYDSEFSSANFDYKILPIPDSILKVYKKIFVTKDYD